MKTIRILLVAALCAFSCACASTSKLSGVLWTSKKSDREARKFADQAVENNLYTHDSIAAAMTKQPDAATVSYSKGKSRGDSTCSSPKHRH